MKTSFRHLLAASIAALVLGSPFAAAAAAANPADRALQLLAAQGTVPLAAVGPYVEIGTFRVQVDAKLGRPDLVLNDGIWLYHHRRIETSQAEGTLVVRFSNGRVSSLFLAGPTVIAALRAQSRATTDSQLLAAK